VWPGDLAPDHPDLGSPLLLLCLVDICDLLAQIEAIVNVNRTLRGANSTCCNLLSGIGVVHALDLNQARLGMGGPAAPLVTQVPSPDQ